MIVDGDREVWFCLSYINVRLMAIYMSSSKRRCRLSWKPLEEIVIECCTIEWWISYITSHKANVLLHISMREDSCT